MEEYILKKEFITLGQFLKEMNVISSGGYAKIFLQEEEVLVNGELENRRGRKLYDQMTVETLGEKYLVRAATAEEQAVFDEEAAEKERVEALVKKMNLQNKRKAKAKKWKDARKKPAKPTEKQPTQARNKKQPPKFPGSK